MKLQLGASASAVLRISAVMVLFASAFASHVARADNSAQPTAPSQPHLRYRIVVDQGKWDEIKTASWAVSPDVGAGIQAQLVDKLQKSGYFIVLERESGAVKQQANEDTVDATKRASMGADASGMAPRQQRIAADYIITPSGIGFQQTSGKKSGFNIGGVTLGGQKSESTLTFNIRISDAQTGEVVDTQTATGKATSNDNSGGASLAGNSFSSDQLNNSPAGQAVDQALDDAVSKIVARLSKEPWRALVAAQDSTTNAVIINAGDLAGVAVGQTFDVYRAGKPILDPDSGAVISAGELTKIGTIRVSRVEHNASFCDVVTGTGFLARDIVQQAKS